MLKFITCCCAIALILSSSLQAQRLSETLTTEQMRTLLSFHTAVWGRGEQVRYQYFHPDGTTVYQENTGKPQEGRWRLTDRDLFCSAWPQQDWLCYQLSYVKKAGKKPRIRWQGPVNAQYAMTKDDYTFSKLEKGNKTKFQLPRPIQRNAILQSFGRVLTSETVIGGTDMTYKEYK